MRSMGGDLDIMEKSTKPLVVQQQKKLLILEPEEHHH